MSGMGFGGMDRVIASERRAYDDGREQGRRGMLWLTAIGATWNCWFFYWDWHPDAMIASHDTAMACLQALADLGDERAREMLRGEP
jgi:hypothetical protein